MLWVAIPIGSGFYECPPKPLFNPTSSNDAGRVLGTRGYLLGQYGPTTDEAVIYSNATVASIGGGSLAGYNGAFLYSNAVLTNVASLGTYNQVTGLNDRNQVVGCSGISRAGTDAYLYSNGVTTDLNSLLPPNSVWDLSYAGGINDSGPIIGSGTYDGQIAGFLLNTDTTTSGGTPNLQPQLGSLAESVFCSLTD